MIAAETAYHELTEPHLIERVTDWVYQLPERRQRYWFAMTLAGLIHNRREVRHYLGKALEQLALEGVPGLPADEANSIAPWLGVGLRVGNGWGLFMTPLTEQQQQELDKLKQRYAPVGDEWSEDAQISQRLRRKKKLSPEQQAAWQALLEQTRAMLLEDLSCLKACWANYLVILQKDTDFGKMVGLFEELIRIKQDAVAHMRTTCTPA